jgi:hypothetical protein
MRSVSLESDHCTEPVQGQAFFRSYDSAPRPPQTPSPDSELDRQHTGRLRKRGSLLTGEEEAGGGCGAESYDGKKAWPSINYSIVSGYSLYIDTFLNLVDPVYVIHEECA